MSKKYNYQPLRTGLWVLAAVVAVILSIATFRLIQEPSGTDGLVGTQVYIAGEEQLALLREFPRMTASVTAILEKGVRVTITEVETSSVQPWVYVESGDDSGWIEAAYISAAPPLP